ncbi:hypothetical protein MTO96_025511 [Rhipicephalus appendiculatus]
MEAVIDTIRLRRRAVSVLLARFAMDATYINLMVNDVTTGIGWEVADVLISVVCYASTLGCMRSCGIRETLSGVMFIVSTFAVLEGLAIFGGQQMLTLPRARRAEGVRLRWYERDALLHGGGLSDRRAECRHQRVTSRRRYGKHIGHRCHRSYGTARLLLTIRLHGYCLARRRIQWLPEVVIKRAQLPGVITESERKAALLASLEPRGVKSSGKHR